MSEIRETAVTWDHNTGEIVISTRRQKVISRLESLGLKGEGELPDYVTFRSTDKHLRISFYRPSRHVSAPGGNRESFPLAGNRP